ncbi:MAG: hypothetical protein Q8P24_15310 [Desulfobacterales bacterium]|nr:hypothetical protein [Desulfobacterales bacterium]
MGKAAKRQKAKRRNYFKHLSETSPNQFKHEWGKRIDSWVNEITKCGGKRYDSCGVRRPSFSEIQDEALNILEACGPGTFRKYGGWTRAVLEPERFLPSYFVTEPGSTSNWDKIEFAGKLHGLRSRV